ncbi:Uncharacterized protein involved in exopolysaccharide biosynthesis [Selenomonas sp. GACV-9]|uniref:GumC family protein n=1 Tax=Selenomonas sp. GACV-9 TaxID=3158782 RepID=UPI0008E3338D|nr:Uncharacterized protein involved in exopolysaccharide biosynthesis [Selenomonas ruminantium]
MENKELQEETIDLGRLARIAVNHKKEVGSIIIGCTLLAAGISFVLPKQYESTALVQTRSVGKDISGLSSMASLMGINIGSGSSNSASPTNYIELMKSRHVLEPVIDSLEWADEKHKPSAAGFAKSNLDIKNTKQTNLITVTAKGRTPEEAQKISQGVVDNFLAMQTDMNQQTQSLLVKFLNERIDTAKKESDDAAQKLAEFSKEHQIYSPDDQAKAVIEQMVAFDKTIGEMQVQQKSAQAQYDVATQKLGEQKAGTHNYNINDNTTVQAIRSSIVDKEVELVGLRQKWTDKHPDVMAVRRQLDKLHSALEDEVNAIVSSNAATINTAQMELLKNQAVAEAAREAASASEVAIKAQKEKKEQEIGKLPDDMMTFLQLKSDAEIKQKIYMSLVQECEQDKIQEAMQSMDIQVIDPADLPDEDKPSAPRWKLITGMGLIIGTILAFGYSLILYKREEER